jgi:four helix bundle protein
MKPESRKKIQEFTDLRTWQEGHALVLLVYSVTKKFPKEEMFGLVSQMRRAAVSVTSNIAEGFGRHGFKEKVQFYYLAHGSLIELKNQIIICKDVGYIPETDFKKLREQLNTTHQLLLGLLKASKTFVNRDS